MNTNGTCSQVINYSHTPIEVQDNCPPGDQYVRWISKLYYEDMFLAWAHKVVVF